jgi:hypothetical protein
MHVYPDFPRTDIRDERYRTEPDIGTHKLRLGT